jgi:hypothetical protein
MIELFAILLVPGILHAIYKLGASPIPSWEYATLAILWGACWPLMLLVRGLEAAYRGLKGGYRQGRVSSENPSEIDPEGFELPEPDSEPWDI